MQRDKKCDRFFLRLKETYPNLSERELYQLRDDMLWLLEVSVRTFAERDNKLQHLWIADAAQKQRECWGSH